MSLEDYEIVSPLGRGGMAETFVAVRRGAGGFAQRVCLKRILPAFADTASFVRSFQEEVRVSAKLRHHNIAQILDFSPVGEPSFLVLELIDGCNLKELIRTLRANDEHIPGGIIAFLAFELGSALEYAHAKGVIHRDISPTNVLVSTAGEVKLTDFGIARSLDRETMTSAGLIKGKLAYMAPEYARRGECSATTDLYALGITLYEAAAGVRPYDAKRGVDMLWKSQKGEHTPLAEITNLPAALCDVIERCLSPDPLDRPQTAHAFLDALASLDPPPTARRLLGRLVVKRRPIDAQPRTDDPSPDGTLVLEPDAVPSRSPQVTPADRHDETRTLMPAEEMLKTEVSPMRMEETPALGDLTEVDTPQKDNDVDDEDTSPQRPSRLSLPPEGPRAPKGLILGLSVIALIVAVVLLALFL